MVDHDHQRWDQNPLYLEAARRTIEPGEATTYHVPRPVNPLSATDVTDFMPGQQWSRDNLPEILYLLKPPPGWEEFRTSEPPLPKLDHRGNPIFPDPDNPRNPLPLLDFPILPDRIGSLEPDWLLEAYRRLDPRIQWRDIMMRVEKPFRPRGKSLPTRLWRTVRPMMKMLSWHKRRSANQASIGAGEAQFVSRLSTAQIEANTTRGSTPGLIDPALGAVPGNVVPWPSKLAGWLAGSPTAATIARVLGDTAQASQLTHAPILQGGQPSQAEPVSKDVDMSDAPEAGLAQSTVSTEATAQIPAESADAFHELMVADWTEFDEYMRLDRAEEEEDLMETPDDPGLFFKSAMPGSWDPAEDWP